MTSRRKPTSDRRLLATARPRFVLRAWQTRLGLSSRSPTGVTRTLPPSFRLVLALGVQALLRRIQEMHFFHGAILP